MHAPRSPRNTSPLRALAWTVLSLLAAGYLRVLVICSGPCCDAHVQLAFAERSCCADHPGGCCSVEMPSSLAIEEAPEAPRSCCAHAGSGGAEEEEEGAPGDAEQLESAGACCTSSPVELGYGPLPLPPTWSRAAELAALPVLAPACAPQLPRTACTLRASMLADRLVDPPPLQNLRAIVSTTLLRI
ncbi:MAG: hypothetical protein IPN34_12100 [Planctomycetes bacterium]|nr:hypothetical protein [Planctomycetota bacterium]